MREFSLSNAEMITLAEQIAVRQAVHQDRVSKMLNLAVFAQFEVVWRTNLFSHDAAGRLWTAMASRGHDTEVVLAMASEFVFRAGLQEGVVEDTRWVNALAKSLSWPKTAEGIPSEIRNLTDSSEKYKSVLQRNYWAVFLYLLSMSDACKSLSLLSGDKRAASEAIAPEGGERV